MKRIIFFLISFVIFTSIKAQEPTIVYHVTDLNSYGISGEITGKKKIALPIVIYANGKYTEPPICDTMNKDEVWQRKCDSSEKIIKPSVKQGKKLYVLNNGKQTGNIISKDIAEYYVVDYYSYAAELASDPGVMLVTNNKSIGLKTLTKITTKPVLEKRVFDGYEMKDTLLSQIDLDGDGIGELVYHSQDYEGEFYQVFSFKNGKWINVFTGSYFGV